MKEKVILSISIGCVALILTMVMLTQFKTVENTDIVAIETMRETELRSEFTTWQTKQVEVEAKLADINSKIEEYKNQMNSEKDATEILEQEVKEAKKFLGYTDVIGEGIIVTLEDNDTAEIERYDLISLINELKHAGAEAISINDERIVNTSDIALINTETATMLRINMATRIASPYVVKAIGDRKYLESAITVKNGFLDERRMDGKTVQYTTVEKNLVITKFQGKMPLDYARKSN